MRSDDQQALLLFIKSKPHGPVATLPVFENLIFLLCRLGGANAADQFGVFIANGKNGVGMSKTTNEIWMERY